MLKRKNILACLLALVMLLSLAACGGGGGDSQPSGGDSQPSGDAGQAAPADPASGDLTEWEQSSGIYNTDETDEELYQKALEEGATVTLYSISSRCTKVADAFMEKYPGLECVPFDIYNFKPADIFSHIDPIYTETQTPLYIELTQLFYNTEAYPDGSPITNLWQLTEPQWKGKIMMQNPLDNLAWGSWIAGFCVGEEPQRLADAYKNLYGEELTLSDGCENAGYEFLKRLHANEPIFTASSDEIAESVGTPGQSDPPVGFCASSKLRKAEENGWLFAPVNLEPDTGIPAVNTLYIVEGSEHPSAAKLLVRFMMGGVDGDIGGYKPFNTLGGWPVRDDLAPAEGSTPFAEINVAPFDATEIYYNYNTVRDFWQQLG